MGLSYFSAGKPTSHIKELSWVATKIRKDLYILYYSKWTGLQGNTDQNDVRVNCTDCLYCVPNGFRRSLLKIAVRSLVLCNLALNVFIIIEQSAWCWNNCGLCCSSCSDILKTSNFDEAGKIVYFIPKLLYFPCSKLSGVAILKGFSSFLKTEHISPASSVLVKNSWNAFPGRPIGYMKIIII